MQITRREGFPVPAAGAVRYSGGHSGESARVHEGHYDQITLSTRPEQENGSFREMVADLSRQVRTVNTTGKIQELRRQVASGQYRPDARETAARILLMAEGD